MALAETLAEVGRGSRHLDARAQLEVEQENLREALRWALRPGERGETDAWRLLCARRTCRSLGWFWRRGGYYAEARRWLELAVDDADSPSPDLAGCLEGLARVTYIQGDNDAALTHIERGLAMARALDEPSLVSDMVRVLSAIQLRAGTTDAARASLEEAVAVGRTLEDPSSLSYALFELGNLEATEGELDRSMELLDMSLPISRRLGDEAQLLMSRHNRACTLREMGQPAAAQREMLELVAATVRQRSPILSIIFAEDYAAVLSDVGEPLACARLLGAAEAARKRSAIPRPAYQEAELAEPIAKARAQAEGGTWENARRAGETTTIEAVLQELRSD